MNVILLLGAPGSGKGSVAARLTAKRGFVSVSSGDMLRDAVARETPAGVEAHTYMARGELVPDALIGRMIGDLLKAGAPDAHYLLDGFPRTVTQLEQLERTLDECGGSIRAAFLIDVSDELVIARIAGRRVCPACKAIYHVPTLPPKKEGICDACGAALVQREDDRIETIMPRLAIYHEQTPGVIDACAARKVLQRIDGASGADYVATRILQVLA